MADPSTPGGPRVVVTGIGMLTPAAIGREPTWSALLAGENAIGPVTLCDDSDMESRVAGEVKDFDPLRYIDRKDARRMDRFTQLAVAASAEALEHSGLDVAAIAADVGVMIGSGIGGIQTLEDQFKVLFERGP
ncbi:MAG: beta-ketoacyl-[acyl-carrier-protein] synthase II, partial [Dehalococcoidia bacterium]|nr:beta-ketoacyl-[acyl-carrier-protein] synthase II [Dehalococcoidia bacterium]